jgi:hypothetical protein
LRFSLGSPFPIQFFSLISFYQESLLVNVVKVSILKFKVVVVVVILLSFSFLFPAPTSLAGKNILVNLFSVLS